MPNGSSANTRQLCTTQALESEPNPTHNQPGGCFLLLQGFLRFSRFLSSPKTRDDRGDTAYCGKIVNPQDSITRLMTARLLFLADMDEVSGNDSVMEFLSSYATDWF